MRKLNYRKKRAIFQGYGQIVNSTIEESMNIDENEKDFA